LTINEEEGESMFDGFIRIEGISGGSSDAKHTGWIEIIDYDSDVSQTVSRSAGTAGGAGAERADFSEFCFTKLLDEASPRLALACADGTHIDTIDVELNRSGGDKIRFMQYRFTNCMISSFNTLGDGDFPEDEVAFVYGKVEWCYARQKRAGGWASGNVAGGWNLEKNCKA
jgi:type VI secretion system secreted protein Hcp